MLETSAIFCHHVQYIELTGAPGVHLPISKSDINFPLLNFFKVSVPVRGSM